MLGVVVVICYGVSCWGVDFGEGGVRVLAMKAFLKTIDPGVMISWRCNSRIEKEGMQKGGRTEARRTSFSS
jgi:hypothetical protein